MKNESDNMKPKIFSFFAGSGFLDLVLTSKTSLLHTSTNSIAPF